MSEQPIRIHGPTTNPPSATDSDVRLGTHATDDTLARRYALQGEIARGGMGTVYRATDHALGREVAVKVLQDRYGPESSAAHRFAVEARVAAQLQHPGIPPLHDFGTLPDGRPFLTMKLIKGHTLEDLLQDRPDAAADRGRFLAIFEQVCQAVAYAHAHQVIHRDLKPANVMVGAFGEVQVMDWGLAKVLSGGPTAATEDPNETASGTVIRSLADTSGSATQAGSVLGTPAFMPPEQAVGAVHQIDTRSDVFGLGAILAVILTGRPPFVADSGEDTRVLAAMGRVDECFSRMDGCGAEPELVTLAKWCLAADRDRRPAEAGVVARAVAAFRSAVEDRARRAELHRVRLEGERATAEARAAERRKRRRLWVGGATAVAVVTVAALAAVVAVEAHKSAQLQLERDAARKAEGEAHANRDEADRQRKLAQARLETAVDAVERMMVRVAGAKWANRLELQQDRREVLEEAVAFFRGFGSEDSKDPLVRRQAGRAYVQAATAYLALGKYDQAVEMARTAADTFQGLAADAPTDPFPLQSQSEATALLGHVSAVHGQYVPALEYYKAASDLAARAVDRDPNSEDSQIVLAETHTSLAMYYAIAAPAKSAAYNAKALAIAERLTTRPDAGFKARVLLVTALTNVAAADLNQGRPQEAMAKIERGRREIPVLDRLRPPSAQAAERFTVVKAAVSVLYGTRLFRAGQQAEGLEAVRAGTLLLDPIVAAQPKSFPLQYQKLQHELTYADLLVRAGKLDEAEAGFDRVDALTAQLLADNPSLGWLKSTWAIPQSHLLVERARRGLAEGLEQKLAALVKGLDNRAAQTVRYNWACVYAVLARTGPPADRMKYADSAMTILSELLKTPYFQSAPMANHLDVDSDLDALRGRDDFQEFVRRAKALRDKFQKPPPVR
jgi:tetratricopeptide (TPR) repeat protein